MRYTSKHVRGSFGRICKALGLTEGSNPGEYALDHYMGGYKIIQYGENGSESEPFGSRRFTAREFCAGEYMFSGLLGGRKVTPVLSPAAGYPLGVTESA